MKGMKIVALAAAVFAAACASPSGGGGGGSSNLSAPNMGAPSGVAATGATTPIDQETGYALYNSAAGYLSTNIETDTAYNSAQSASLAPSRGAFLVAHGQSGRSYLVPKTWVNQLKSKIARSAAARSVLIDGSKSSTPISGDLVDGSNGGAVVGSYMGSLTLYDEASNAFANAGQPPTDSTTAPYIPT